MNDQWAKLGDPAKYFKDNAVAACVEAHVASTLPVSGIDPNAVPHAREQQWAAVVHVQYAAFVATHGGDPFDPADVFVVECFKPLGVATTIESRARDMSMVLS